jgi:hypothetical protein
MAILANQKILTLDYWKFANDLKVGDIIFDRHGMPRKVTALHKYAATLTFRGVFNDLLEVEGDEHLSFLVETPKYRKQLDRYKNVRPFQQKLKKIAISDSGLTFERLSLPTTNPIKLPHQDLPVPPFIFGFWFFNRRSTKKLAAPKGYSKKVHEILIDHGYQIHEHAMLPKGEREFTTYPKIESQLAGVPTHRIPANYLMASEEQRIELLRGIMHAKARQYNKSKNTFRFATTHQAIALQVQGLLESLGHRLSLFYDVKKKFYRITFRSKLNLVDNQPAAKNLVHNGRRYIDKVETLPAQLCVHIETDGPDNSFLVGEGFIPCL